MTVYISGIHAGPNPSPGVGLARSLRRAYPTATLVGVDYSARSTGIHWPDFDDILLVRPWDELDLPAYEHRVRTLLASGAWWISTLDLETVWLARCVGGDPHLLVPGEAALQAIAKPPLAVGRKLGIDVPSFIPANAPAADLHAFVRAHSWRVWVKGGQYEARAIRTWSEFLAARDEIAAVWPREGIFVQADVAGHEESLAFAAYRGRLLRTAYMTKQAVTGEGKTWAGRIVRPPDPGLVDALQGVVRTLDWSGGAELEFVRDDARRLHLIECNGRFPAWIFGATLSGENLPAALLEEASGERAAPSAPESSEFVRVVVELPTRRSFPLPPVSERPPMRMSADPKHPSGMPRLAARVRTPVPQPTEATDAPPPFRGTMAWELPAGIATPAWVRFPRMARAAFRQVHEAAQSLSSPSVSVVAAYSLKTNPSAFFARLALRHEFFAEVVTDLEIKAALRHGFPASRIVANGPGKRVPWGPSPPVGVRFCDSVEELTNELQSAPGDGHGSMAVGVRLRPPQVESRFGISVDTYAKFTTLVELVRQYPENVRFGVHFHIASSAVGTDQWWHVCDGMLEWAGALAQNSGKSVYCVDFGGGWFPDDLYSAAWMSQIAQRLRHAERILPGLRLVIFEPGKALTQASAGLAVRILEVRREKQRVKEVVVDGSVAQLSQASVYPHPVLARGSGTNAWRALSPGDGRILGRLCLEQDILAMDVGLPPSLQPGDVLIVLSAGAYDRSMSYGFATGAPNRPGARSYSVGGVGSVKDPHA